MSYDNIMRMPVSRRWRLVEKQDFHNKEQARKANSKQR
jgi:hypothetical protein